MHCCYRQLAIPTHTHLATLPLQIMQAWCEWLIPLPKERYATSFPPFPKPFIELRVTPILTLLQPGFTTLWRKWGFVPFSLWSFPRNPFAFLFVFPPPFASYQVLPRLRTTLMEQTCVFVPSYFDFVRLRNYTKQEDVPCARMCEWVNGRMVAIWQVRNHQLVCFPNGGTFGDVWFGRLYGKTE